MTKPNTFFIRKRLHNPLILVGLLSPIGLITANANDVTTPVDFPKQELNVWVNDAPLSLVVDQLAKLSGLELIIDGELAGQVSGRYKGSMENTLSDIASSHDVLFDLREGSLSAVSKTSQKTASIAFSSPTAEESLQNLLDDVNASSGNIMEIKAGAVQLSGHPDFVERTASEVTATLSAWRSVPEVQSALPQVKESLAAETHVDVVDQVHSERASENVLSSTKPLAPLEYMGDGLETDLPSTEVPVARKEILWVTDIPGFDTF